MPVLSSRAVQSLAQEPCSMDLSQPDQDAHLFVHESNLTGKQSLKVQRSMYASGSSFKGGEDACSENRQSRVLCHITKRSQWSASTVAATFLVSNLRGNKMCHQLF